jgi:DNA-binding transcriptional MerR regulator
MTTTTLGPRELARQGGVSTDTLRHYERKGLLARPQRTSAGYRRYPAEAVGRVRLIQRALVVGFSLNELARVLKERDRGGAPCRSVRALLDTRLADLTRQIGELRGLRRELIELARLWDTKLATVPAGARAHLLEALHERPALDPARARRRTQLATSSPRRSSGS